MLIKKFKFCYLIIKPIISSLQTTSIHMLNNNLPQYPKSYMKQKKLILKNNIT